MGRFPFNKNSCLKFWNSTCPVEWCIPVAQIETTILSNGKGYFGATAQNDQTSQSGPPYKEVPNIPVRLNGNGLFYLLISNRRILFLKYWAEWSGPCYLADEMMREIYFIFFFQTQMSQFPLVSQISGCGTLLMSLFIRLAFEKNSLLFKRFSTNRNVI